ncbi:unnamed protein product [Blepharisma stoltei]|uniref:Cyclin N-terminal domain-containing protein n=1 Tax=Blepharisma stoltei TaxID=1481888 RepID=A0AAU9JGH4_9CILI|nr:unnamed protein product [Blepharisma stoltei]
MNLKSLNSLEDKENLDFRGKHRDLPSTNRSFGSDLTRVPLQTRDIDKEDESDPQRLGDYAKDIFSYLHTIEQRYIPQYGYMRSQRDISEKMRAILIDWLVEVHHKFKLLPETLFLTVNIIDRFLEKEIIPRNQLQLIGVTSMLIASKFEEIYAPEIKDFVYISDKSCSKEEIIRKESEILRVLDFNITTVSPLRFLERYARISNLNERGYSMAKYFIELSIIEYKMLRYKASILAASAIYLANKIQGSQIVWPQSLVENSPYKESDLKPCARDLCMLVQGAEKCSLQAIRKKYSQPAYLEVAKIVIISQPHK